MRPSLPLTARMLSVPDCKVQGNPSLAVPHPLAAVRPAKLSRESSVPAATGDPEVAVGVGVGVPVGVGVNVAVTVGVAVAVGLGPAVGVAVAVPGVGVIVG